MAGTEQLTGWAVSAMRLFADEAPYERTRSVATTVGAQAARAGVSVAEMRVWLQAAYGAVFVRHTNLNPGMDLKDVQNYMLAGYAKALR